MLTGPAMIDIAFLSTPERVDGDDGEGHIGATCLAATLVFANALEDTRAEFAFPAARTKLAAPLW